MPRKQTDDDDDLDDKIDTLETFVDRHNLRREAAQALGISDRMLYWYLNGKYEVPATVLLLIEALEENQKLKSQ